MKYQVYCGFNFIHKVCYYGFAGIEDPVFRKIVELIEVLQYYSHVNVLM